MRSNEIRFQVQPLVRGKALAPRLVLSMFLTVIALCRIPVNILGQASSFPDAFFPADTGIINVKTAYGAVGDGIADDTTAIRAAIANNVGTHRTLYFPPGTYLISEQLDWRNTNNQWRCYLTLQGAGANRTIIKLKDNAAGFGSAAAAAKPMLRSGSKTDDPKCSNYNRDSGDGGGNCAFNNYIFDLTVNTGSGNPKAVGVDFIASNNGAMVNVQIVSGDATGSAGLSLRREVGPALIKNVSVKGFDYGIDASRDLYGITFENISLTNQKVYGLRNSNNSLHIRRLHSNNIVPAIANVESSGLVTLVDSILVGGSPTTSAILNNGKLFARNVTTTGYQSAIKNGATIVSGSTVTEFVSHPIKSLFASPPQSLNLPVRDTPEFRDNNSNNWANVESFGAAKNNSAIDDTAGIQAAIDSGKETVYLPFGTYNISGTLFVRGNVKRIVGFSSRVTGASESVIRFENPHDAVLEKIRFEDALRLEHATSQALAAKYITDGVWRNTLPVNSLTSGPYFFEDYCCNSLSPVKQDVWARQLNLEDSTPLLTNDNGRLWVLGLKTEGTRTALKTINDGYTELLGGLLYGTGGDKTPMFINENSSVSLTFSEIAYTSGNNWQTYVQETRDGVTQTLSRSAAQSRGYGGIVPLYVGYINAPPPPITSIIVDNGDAGFSTINNWTTSTRVPGFYGGNYLHDGDNRANTDTAKWLSPVTAPGTYNVYLRWTAQPGSNPENEQPDPSRPDAAPLEINYAGGMDSSKIVNQQINGGRWVFIGTYPFAPNDGDYVMIRASDAGYTIADAVMFEPVTILSATADAYVRNGSYSATNYGSGAQLIVKQDADVGYMRESFLQFDTSSVVGEIKSAKLRVYGGLLNAATPNFLLTLYSVPPTSGAWSESAITWNNKPQLPALAAGTIAITSPAKSWYEFDVSSVLNAERAAGRSSVNFALAGSEDAGNNYVQLNSREATTNQPQLVILQ